MGGKYKNNVGRVADKIKFLSSYKFSIAMENTEGDGYISEKIIDSFLSGSIPIYYGSYMFDEYINPKSFIFIRGENDINQKIEYIKLLDNNDELYNNVLKENIFINKKNVIKKTEELEEYIYHIFEQNLSMSKRIDTSSVSTKKTYYHNSSINIFHYMDELRRINVSNF